MRWLVCSVLVAVIGFAPLAHPVAERDSRQTELIGPEAQLMPLALNRGQLVRFADPAASVFVADPKIADVQVKSPTLAYVFGKQAGETSLFAVDSGDRLLANLQISVSHNIDPIERAMTTLLPDAAITVEPVGDAVMLKGMVPSATVAEDARALAARFAGDSNVINRLVVAGPNQVNLRVRVAEVNRAVVKQIGVNWDAVLRMGSFAFGLVTGNPLGAAAADAVTASVEAGGLDINGVLDALENEGLVSVLAEPNLTAVSGETASFLAGGEFPITVPQADNTITVEFKKFGVGLSFTPTVLGPGRISLKVRPEVSQLSSTGEVRLNNISVPGLATRRAETTVELGSGQSFAIAGLIQNNLSHDVRRFPGLGDVPVLGTLFRSDQFRRNETELVIIVTPYVVRPVSTARLSSPTDGLVMPGDRERLAGGPLYRPAMRRGFGTPVESGRPGLAGAAGFGLE